MVKQKSNQFLIILFISLTVFFIFRMFFVHKIPVEFATKGYLDCSDYEYQDFMCSLNGEWMDSLSETDIYTSFPDCINEIDSNNHSYILSVKLPKSKALYSIMIPPINGSYEIFINGKSICQAEKINHSNNEEYIQYLQYHSFYADTKTVTITINYKNNSNLIINDTEIEIGSTNAIMVKYLTILLPDILFCCIFLMSAIYFFTISIREERNKLYYSLSLICLCMLIHSLLSNSCLLGIALPHIQLSTINAVAHLTRPALLICVIYHLRQGIPYIITQNLYQTYTLSVLIHIILVLIMPGTASYLLTISYVIQVSFIVIIMIYTGIKIKALTPETFLPYVLTALSLSSGLIIDLINNTPYTYEDFGLAFFYSIFVLIRILRFLQEDQKIFNQEHALMVSYKNTLFTKKTEETNFLSSHLKPHFLFNALNIISGYAIYEPPKAKEITKSLIVYLRQLFEHDNLNEMNSIENEVNLVKAFGHIESERFPNINIEYNIDNSIPMDFMIPSLILQPLLENAVNHGIRKKPSKFEGHIYVSINNSNNYLEFKMYDNGKGMDDDTVKKAVSKPEDNKFHCLYHINLRLNELYNENLLIESKPDEGTTVSFKIPL